MLDLMRSLAVALLLFAACGSVDSEGGAGGAGGAAGAAGSGASATGGRNETGGTSATGGADATGGHDATGGTSATGGVSGGGDGGPGAGGAGGGASTAPACKGTFVGSVTVCPRVPATPQQPSGWQCEVNCSSSSADNAAGCTFNGVTYCVSDCSLCRP